MLWDVVRAKLSSVNVGIAGKPFGGNLFDFFSEGVSCRCLSRFFLVLFRIKFTESARHFMELLRHRVSAVSGGFGECQYTLFPELRQGRRAEILGVFPKRFSGFESLGNRRVKREQRPDHVDRDLTARRVMSLRMEQQTMP